MEQNAAQNRWLALDAIKTLAILGTILCHIFVWFLGDNQAGGAYLYSLSVPPYLALAYFSFVMLLIITSGAGFYFYINKKDISLRSIIKRSLTLIFIGILFGLNTNPFIIFWNIFFFYAVALLIIELFYRKWGINSIAWLSLISFVATPIFRFLFGQNTSYLAGILIGDKNGITSVFPILPWISIIGVGFLISAFFEKIHKDNNTEILKKVSAFAFVTGLISLFLLPIPDLSNIFGVTARISIIYLVYCTSLFLVTVSLFDMVLLKEKLSRYNPVQTIGKHVLSTYLVGVFVMLGVTGAFPPHRANPSFVPYYIWANVATVLLAYLSSVWFERRRLKKLSRFDKNK